MKSVLTVGVIFGGKSAEHEVSLRSAKNVIEAIDKTKYQPLLILVDKNGKWLAGDGSGDEIALVPESGGKLFNITKKQWQGRVDVVFPILHGPFGEDGTVQGLLKLANVPFVGAGVLGSAVGMDKEMMKRLLRDAGIAIGDFLTFRAPEQPVYAEVVATLGTPLFIKPANLGSSVGVSKVLNEQQFVVAIDEAFRYDRKILIEQYIEGREIECALLGNEQPQVSVPGEIIASHAFYSYEAKYLDENGATLEIPAKLTAEQAQTVQAIARKTFTALDCEGLGRVDMFMRPNGEVVVNEINTLPGFTSISMYPKLWEASGVTYSQLIDQLITLALQRASQEQQLATAK